MVRGLGGKKHLLVLLGATGTGKSALGVRVAGRIGSEVVSADARQLYHKLFIGTAQLSDAEKQGIRHHLMGCYDLDVRLSAGSYARRARALLRRLFQQHEVVLLVGGTGFYISALCEGLPAIPVVSPDVQSYWQTQYQSKGIRALQAFVSTQDPVYYRQADIHNPVRLMRAAAVIQSTGQRYSSFVASPESFKPLPYEIKRFGLWHDRQVLYRTLNARVDAMMRNGLYEEAKGLYPEAARVPPTHGYQEIFAHLDGKYSLDEAVRLIKRNTRRYAKRQYTWFGQDPNIQWLSPEQKPEEYILSQLHS